LALQFTACDNAGGLPAQSAEATATVSARPAPSSGQVLGGIAARDSAQDPNLQISGSRETAIIAASERVAPAVVAVNVLRTEQIRTRDPFWDDFFPFGGFGGTGTTEQLVPSLGSGFVVNPDGLILTNDHVVRGAERILVTFPDGRDAEAALVGTDEATDVAVLSVDETGLPAVPIGTTADLRIGEWVIALGNPFGNMLSNPEPTVTVGVVSAVGRHIVPTTEDRGFYLGMIQTDAAINPGNSGGPLVNAAGEVVGMNASIFSRSGGSEGMGFAIPIERVLRIADDLVEYGEVRRAWLGLDVEPEEADPFGRTRGVRVLRASDGSPAEQAGLGSGDRLVAIGDQRLATPLDFEAALLDLRVGDEVLLTVDGSGEAVRLVAEEPPSLRAERVRVFEDLELITVTPSIRSERSIGSERGALVTGVSPALGRILGLQAGDVIVGLNNRLITSAEELTDRLDEMRAGSRAWFHFERNGGCCLVQEFVLGL
jgi:serine protease Do